MDYKAAKEHLNFVIKCRVKSSRTGKKLQIVFERDNMAIILGFFLGSHTRATAAWRDRFDFTTH